MSSELAKFKGIFQREHKLANFDSLDAIREAALKESLFHLDREKQHPFITNLQALNEQIVNQGKSEHGKGYYSWDLQTYKGAGETDLVFWGKSIWDSEKNAGSMHVGQNINGASDGNRKRIEISGDGKIDIDINLKSFPEALRFEKITHEKVDDAYWKSKGKKAVSHYGTMCITSPIKDLSPATIEFLNETTKEMLGLVKDYLSDPKRAKEPQRVGNLSNTTDRQAILNHLRNVVKMDKQRYYNDIRHPDEYKRALFGVEAMFDYIKTLKTSRKVVDVGAGVGLAIKAIGEEYGEGLEIVGTNLTVKEELSKNLGKENVRITPAEFMKGFEPNSIAGIIAVSSIAYSTSPELVMNKMYEILVPGGVMKAVFRRPDQGDLQDYGFQRYDEFLKFAKESGFDTAVDNESVLLAMKPGEGPETAASLLAKDKELYQKTHLETSWQSYTASGDIYYHSTQKAGYF